ncbi:unnamed protein product [Ambrosiozyma monospora]|uniref:Unnamed protein product n=1 Tax=Ambrosiozyma monospora TaxID=43982 RepID=A0A9W6Z524_AMBMO|nr:unnamed protein product [Ambrosiozyma monospora]
MSELTREIWHLDSLETLNVSSNNLSFFPDEPTTASTAYASNSQETPESQKLPPVSPIARLPVPFSAPVPGPSSPVTPPSAPPPPAILERLSVPPTNPGDEEYNTMLLIETNSMNSLSLRDKNNKTPVTKSIPVDKPIAEGIGKSLKVLSMNDNHLNDSVIERISIFKNLEVLNLSYNELYDIPYGQMSKLTNLRSLYLSGNNLSSLPVDDLDSFKQLTTLHLNGNKFHSLPPEFAKLTSMTSLDVGSNELRYNIGNIPYDWNWYYNKKLMYLNLSGNKRLEIKPQHRGDDVEVQLDSFLFLKQLRVLGLMDVTITTDAVPDQTLDVRVRSTSSQLGKFGYGISDTLGNRKHITTRDVVIEKFREKPDEMLITIYDGKNCPQSKADKISKVIQETFESHFTTALATLGTQVRPGHLKTVEDCLRGAFLSMNSEMNILINKDESSTFSSAAAHRTSTTAQLDLEEDGFTGCGATMVYIKKDMVYVANIGDTMGIVTKSNGDYDIITAKHEPYAPGEYERIRESGGYVNTEGYLDNIASISRAVGFFKLIPHVTASPNIYKFKLTSNEQTIALATNEIWKKVPFGLAADIVSLEKSRPGIAAEKLRDYAISYGASDKCTAVVLSLGQFNDKPYEKSADTIEDLNLRNLGGEIKPPTGHVALVFTDIKNSTLLWDTFPFPMRSAIKVHNSIMRRQLRIIGGYEVKTEGDAFMTNGQLKS